MTLPVFFGCSFIAFGPALGLLVFTVLRDPLRVIVLVAGAFFWLVSLLLSSLVWFIAVKASDPGDEPLQKGLLIFGVLFSVLLQEAFRFLYYKLLRKAVEGLVTLSEDGCSPISIQQMAYAFMTMVMIFLHTFWGILFFHGCETQHWWEMAAVILTHLIVSGSGSRARQAPSQDPEGPSGALPSAALCLPCPPSGAVSWDLQFPSLQYHFSLLEWESPDQSLLEAGVQGLLQPGSSHQNV
ncbi:gamma-secretase subunit Aph-1b isoform X3 [Caretta caretta]|uniref:gamma-secretase subunit Aph-1b isoform X3 n=1 Tax=Caretta caretta TaxID=8467 RepID=UPI003F4B0D79